MNCASARNRILTQPDPAAVPAAVAGHLAACPGCQGWHRLLIQVETAIAAVPVPATDGRARRRLLQLFRNGQSDSGRLKLGATAAEASKPVAEDLYKAEYIGSGTFKIKKPKRNSRKTHQQRVKNDRRGRI